MSKLTIVIFVLLYSLTIMAEECHLRRAVFYHSKGKTNNEYYANHWSTSPVRLEFINSPLPDDTITSNEYVEGSIVTKGHCGSSCQAKFVKDLVIAFPGHKPLLKDSVVKKVWCGDYFAVN